jgi:hypothetical protein
MKTVKLACNYAIIRFLPYPETEEFVNVGVVLACPGTHYFDFRIETTERRRVNAFFPELNKSIFTLGRTHFRKELDRVRSFMDRSSNEGMLDFAANEFNKAFLDVVKPRESIFRFSGVGTRLAEDPEEALDQLFDHYVVRLFAQRKDYQETEMVKRLRESLRSASIMGYRNGLIGNDLYEVPFPLLRKSDGATNEFRAIKPLDLAKEKPTAITVHGDEWLAKLGHLKKMSYDLKRVLFAVQMPHDEPANIQVAEEIFDQIRITGVELTRIDDTERITDFARVV